MKISNLFNSKKVNIVLEQLYGRDEAKKKASRLAKKKCSIFFLIFFITILIFVPVYISSGNKEILSIKRNTPGMGKKTVSVTAVFDDIGRKEVIPVVVDEKKYTSHEIDEFSKKLEDEIWQVILGNNKSLEYVDSNLMLLTEISGYPFEINWKSEKPLIIKNNGIIDSEKLSNELERTGEEYVTVELCATISYEDFSEDLYRGINLFPEGKSEYEEFVRRVREEIIQSGIDTRESDEQTLPLAIDGVRIHYFNSDRYKSLVILLMGFVSIFLINISKDKELEKELSDRNKELDREYPRILNQYALYYCAGMSHRNIWNKIIERYERQCKKGKGIFVYEQMSIAEQKMRDGMGEINAYEEFANRCNSVKYRAFINLIEQSIKKGSEELNVILDEEVLKARREELNRVKMLAQELSTKLLFPMMLMLIIVLVIVMVPAFISFNK